MDSQIRQAIEDGKNTFERNLAHSVERCREFLRKDSWLVKQVRQTAQCGKNSFEFYCDGFRGGIKISDLTHMVTAIKEFGIQAQIENENQFSPHILVWW